MKTNSVTISFPWATILTVLFAVLKLTGTISWSWWWVFSPLWIVAGLLVLAFIVLGVLSFFLRRAERELFNITRKQK